MVVVERRAHRSDLARKPFAAPVDAALGVLEVASDGGLRVIGCLGARAGRTKQADHHRTGPPTGADAQPMRPPARTGGAHCTPIETMASPLTAIVPLSLTVPPPITAALPLERRTTGRLVNAQ